MRRPSLRRMLSTTPKCMCPLRTKGIAPRYGSIGEWNNRAMAAAPGTGPDEFPSRI